MENSLNMEQIKSIMSNLLTKTCGFMAYAVTKESPRLKKMCLAETGEDGGLKGILRAMILDVIVGKYLSDDAKYEYAEKVADNQNVFYVIKQTEEYKPFDYLSGEKEPFKGEHLQDISGFVFEFRYDMQSIFCFQKGRSVMVPNRHGVNIVTKLLCRDDSVIWDQQKEALLTITKAIDAVIINESIITNDIKMMERNFDFQVFISEKAKMAASNVANTGFFTNTNKLDEYLSRGGSRQKTYYKKMMRAIDSPVLQMKAEDLFQKITTVERWKGQFKSPVGGKIPLDTFKEVESLIDLLDERYTKSEITNQEYDSIHVVLTL